MPNADVRAVPTVSRVCTDTMIELVYDRAQRTTALVVSRFRGLWNIEQEVVVETGERLVPYPADNNLIAHDCVLLPSEPVPHGAKEELIADIEAFLHRHVDLSPVFERLAAHYVLLTWLYDAFSELPYLRLRGDYGTGKTRGLLAIGSLCYKPFFAAGASTVSPIFHTLDRFGGTLILDEADFRFSDATTDLVKIFNNGTVKGLPVLRTIANRNKEFNPAAFRVFGPKIIAMRGSFADEALESRFLTEETGTRPLRDDIPLHLSQTLETEALMLRNRLLHFRLSTFFSTKLDPSLAAVELDPRLNQITLPLLSLVDDPELRGQIQDLLRQQQRQSALHRSHTLEGRVLQAALESLAEVKGTAAVPIQAVADRLNRTWRVETGHAVSARRVGSVLRGHFKVDTRKTHGSYVIASSERSKLEQLSIRYGVANPDR